MDYNKAALEMHETHKGKVGIVSKVEVATRDDLSTAYTPGVAEPCRKIKENPDDVYKYTFKGNMVAVVSNGTAVLGLGDIGPEAGLPVMEGKAVLFKEFGGVDAFPICIDAHDAASVIAACKAIAPTFGGINLEDIKAPECFEIERRLKEELDAELCRGKPEPDRRPRAFHWQRKHWRSPCVRAASRPRRSRCELPERAWERRCTSCGLLIGIWERSECRLRVALLFRKGAVFRSRVC